MAITAKSFTFLLISSLFLVSCFCAKEARDTFPVVNGLSWSFYDYSCPKAESIIRKQLKKVFKNDIGQAAGLLRLHFHDCFVQVTK
jgi:peroxidase